MMVSALRGLQQQPRPSECGSAEMLDGLQVITELAAAHAGGAVSRRSRAAQA